MAHLYHQSQSIFIAYILQLSTYIPLSVLQTVKTSKDKKTEQK